MEKLNYILMILLFSVNYLQSQTLEYGKELKVNTQDYVRLANPAIAVSPNGTTFIVWEDGNSNTDGVDIFGRMIDARGDSLKEVFKINSFLKNDQFHPKVACFNDSNFIVCWNCRNRNEDGIDIYGQMYKNDGSKIGTEIKINTSSRFYQYEPEIASLKSGGFVVAWWNNVRDGNVSNRDVYAQVFDSKGEKINNEICINEMKNGQQHYHSIFGLENGGFVVCWHNENGTLSRNDVYTRVFDAYGSGISVETLVNENANSTEPYPSGTSLKNGDFLICWMDSSVKVQRFNKTGDKISQNININSEIQKFSGSPRLVQLDNGHIIVTWIYHHLPIGEKYGLYLHEVVGQVLNQDLDRIYNEFFINTNPNRNQYNQSIAKYNKDGFIVTWCSYENSNQANIYVKKFPPEPRLHQLSMFSLLDPPNDATINTVHPLFSWEQPSELLECYSWEIVFDLYIDKDPLMRNPQTIYNIHCTNYVFEDSLNAGNTYFWKVLARNLNGDSIWSTETNGFFIKYDANSNIKINAVKHLEYKLLSNFPNPFNQKTNIQYQLPRQSYVCIKVLNMLGEEVATLFDNIQSEGNYQVYWDATPYASGLYYYHLKAEDAEGNQFEDIKKMVLLK